VNYELPHALSPARYLFEKQRLIKRLSGQ